MSDLTFKKLNELPENLDANTLYLIPNTETNGLSLRMTDNLGTKAYKSKARRPIQEPGGLELWIVGDNIHGQLGIDEDSTSFKSTPVQISPNKAEWKNVVLGTNFSAAIKTDGTLWLWGVNGNGQLGTNDIESRSSPVQTVAGGSNWIELYTQAVSIIAVKDDNTIWAWGAGSNGRLATNNSINRSSPVQILIDETNWKMIAAGGSNGAIIKEDNSLWLWGLNNNGQLGTNNLIARSSPVQTISGGNNWAQIAFSNATTVAIKTDGTLWLWGLNNNGQLGINDIESRSSPVQTISGGSDWSLIKSSTSAVHIGCIKTDGSLWMWGAGWSGRLGNNSTIARSSPIQVHGGHNNWVDFSLGAAFTIATKTDGSLWAWGRGVEGQIGINLIANRLTPAAVIVDSRNWVGLNAGGAHAAYLRTPRIFK